jgi:hypothetical protein
VDYGFFFTACLGGCLMGAPAGITDRLTSRFGAGAVRFSFFGFITI